jgi:hypothetical protein
VEVTVTRRGGLAGIAIRGTCDTSEFPGAEEALRSLRAAAAPPHPDAFTYDFEYDDQKVTLNERDLSEPLRALSDTAVARGELL